MNCGFGQICKLAYFTGMCPMSASVVQISRFSLGTSLWKAEGKWTRAIKMLRMTRTLADHDLAHSDSWGLIFTSAGFKNGFLHRKHNTIKVFSYQTRIICANKSRVNLSIQTHQSLWAYSHESKIFVFHSADVFCSSISRLIHLVSQHRALFL